MPTVRDGDINLYYETVGAGPPVVMSYGIGGDGRQWWEEFPRRLAEHYRLVVLDNRGTGLSGMPPTAWTMEDVVADFNVVIRDAGLESFHLLGCSLGSVFARHYVRLCGGDQIRSLSLLCAPNGISATEEDLRTALFWDRSKPLLESAAASWPIVHPDDWVKSNRDLLMRRFEESMKNPTPATTFQFQLQAVQQAGDLALANAAAAGYDWPVFIMHGTLDRLVPFENGVTLQQAIPRARLEVLEGAGHNFWQHDPERAAAAVIDFLDQAEARLVH